MASLWLDFRHVLRALRRSPTFTVVTILVLGVGIGANTAMFTLVRGVLFQPLPFSEPDSLVWLIESVPAMNMPVFPFNAPDVTDLAEYSATLEEVASFQNREMELSGEAEARPVVAGRISVNLFPILGLEPAMGRGFSPDEDVPRAGVAILSYRLWQERFGGSGDVLGRRIELDRQPYSVVGVMPRSAAFPLHKMPMHGAEAEVFLPMGFTEIELASRGMMHNLGVIGRVAEGVDLEAVRSEMESIGPRILASYPGADQGGRARLLIEATPLRDIVVGQIQRPLLLLFGAMGLVMLVVCANVANLTLSRSLARRGEMALRTALGATRGRLAQIYLIESLLLALSGGALGLLIAQGVLKVSQSVLHKTLPLVDRTHIDALVVLFVLGLSLVVALLFGWAPVLGSAFRSRALAHASSRGTQGRAERRILRGVAVLTMVLAVVLLVGAGLLLRSFGELLALDPGFSGDRVLTLSVALPNQAYPEPERVLGFVSALEERVAGLPGVEAATITSALPMESRERRVVVAEDPLESDERHSVSVTWASHGYLDTVGLRLRSGRFFQPSDRGDGAAVVVVSEEMARQHWGDARAVGRRLSWRLSEGGQRDYAEVVGVVGEVNDGPLGADPTPHLYVPLAQFDPRELAMAYDSGSPWGRVFRVAVLSASADPTILAGPVANQIHEIDRSLAVAEIQTLDQKRVSGVSGQRLAAGLVGAFSLTALLLAAIGLYGVLAYATERRRREFGVRLALGAEGSSLVGLVMKQGLLMATVGLALGLLAAVGLSRFVASVLFQTSPNDPLTLAAVAAVLLLAAAVASWLPAWRAGRVDPVTALRAE